MSYILDAVLIINLLRFVYGLYVVFKSPIGGLVWFLISTLELSILFVYVGESSGIYLFILIIISFILNVLILLLGKKRSNDKPDFLIILGNALKKNKMSKNLKYRLDKAIVYARNNQNTRIIVTGGLTGKNTIAEAIVMNNYLKENGIQPSSILIEDKSSTTVENFKNVITRYPIIKKSNLMIVSSNYHLLRARIIAKKNNLNVVSTLSSKIELLMIPNQLLFERIFIFLALINKLK